MRLCYFANIRAFTQTHRGILNVCRQTRKHVFNFFIPIKLSKKRMKETVRSQKKLFFKRFICTDSNKSVSLHNNR